MVSIPDLCHYEACYKGTTLYLVNEISKMHYLPLWLMVMIHDNTYQGRPVLLKHENMEYVTTHNKLNVSASVLTLCKLGNFHDCFVIC